MRRPLNTVPFSLASGLLAALAAGCAGADPSDVADGFADPPVADADSFARTGDLPPPIITDPDHDFDPVAAPFAPKQYAPQTLRLHDSSLYWVDDAPEGALLRWIHTDGGPSETVANLGALPHDAAVDDTGLYLTQPSTQKILFVPHHEDAVTHLHSAAFDPLAIGVDGDSVYWTSVDGCVSRGAKDGGDPEEVACAEGLPVHLVVTDDQLYWATVEGVLYTSGKAAGSAAVKLASGESFSAGIAVDDNYVFWANELERDVRRLSRYGGAVDVIATAQFAPAGLTQDRFYLYMTTFTEGAVKAIPKTGGYVDVVAAGQSQPAGIAQNDDFVFWVNEGEGVVMRGVK